MRLLRGSTALTPVSKPGLRREHHRKLRHATAGHPAHYLQQSSNDKALYCSVPHITDRTRLLDWGNDCWLLGCSFDESW